MADGYERFFQQAKKAAQSGTKFTLKQQGSSVSTSPAKRAKASSKLTPEEQIRRELAERIRSRRDQKVRRMSKFPLGPVVGLAAALGVSALVYVYSDQIDRWAGSIEVSLFGSARAAGDTAKPAAPPSPAKSSPDEKEKKEKLAGTKVAQAGPVKTEAPPVKQWTQDELSFFAKLDERKRELDQRESELNKLEEELQKRKTELDVKLKQLEAMREEISKTLKTRVANDQTKVDKLVQFYSTMKPVQAAKVIESLNEDLAVEILDKMKKKNAAEILDMMNAKKARRLSELITGYQRSVASTGGEESDDSQSPAADAKGAKEDTTATKKK